MHKTTPFEISLVHQLGQDSIRMANDWFFKWHSINIPNQMVDVEDFYGGRIRVGGILFVRIRRRPRLGPFWLEADRA